MKKNQIAKKALTLTLLSTILVTTMILLPVSATDIPYWDVSGQWSFENNSTQFPDDNPYQKEMEITMDASGIITGSGKNIPVEA
jgi:hypothetical protein